MNAEDDDPRATVMVTGGAGFVGSRLCADLGDRVIAPRRSDLDLTDLDQVEGFLRTHEIRSVVHLAACLDRTETREAQAAQWRDTFTATRVVLEASALAGVRRVIALGSLDEVGTIDGMVGPDAPIAPASTYGLCKALGLATARFLVGRHDLRVEWARPSTVYGPGQRGPMLVPAAFRSGVSGESTAFTSGVQKRDFIYVDDVISWIARALLIDDDPPAVTVHHLGSGQPTAVAEVLRRIERLTGGTFELGALPRRVGEPDLFGPSVVQDPRSPLNDWRAQVDLDTGLELVWHDWQQNDP